MITLVEKSDPMVVRWICENFDYIYPKLGISENSKEAQRTIINDYYRKINKQGEVFVNYTSNLSQNRLFARGGVSLQGMSKSITHTIVKGSYEDWDMSNAHPVLLLKWCKDRFLPVPLLEKYVNDRDNFIAEIEINGVGEEKGQISHSGKIEVLRIINGGNIYDDVPKLLRDFYYEIEFVRKQLCHLAPRWYEEGLKPRKDGRCNFNPEGRAISYLMSSMEAETLKIMYDYLQSIGVIPRVLAFDGIMIDKRREDKTLITPEISADIRKELSRVIFEKTGTNIELVSKPMLKGIDIPKIKKIIKCGSTLINLENPLFGVYPTDYVKVVDIPENVKWVQDIVFPEGFTSVAIKAPLGRGKTTAIINFINKNDPKKIIVLSPRKSYASNITEELNSGITTEKFVNYLNVTPRSNLRNCNRIVISPESLHYLAEDNYNKDIDFDLFIGDEIHSNLIQNVCLTTNKKHLDVNLQYFQRLVTETPRKIYADAFLGQKFIRYITNMKVSTTIFNYNCKMEEKTVIRVPLLRKIDCVKLKQKLKEKITPSDAMLTKIFELIKENKKIYVVSASKDRLKKWKDILLKLYPDINMIVYTGDNNSTRKRDDFSNIREKWSNADIVMTTTTITIGINFDVKNHFDVVCLHASKSAKNVIADLFQSHYRVRYPRDKVLYLSIDTFYNQPKLPITLNEIENHQGLVRDYFLEIKQKFVNPPPAIWDLVMDNILERNLGTQQIEMIIDKYLFECNYIERDSAPIDNIEDICDEYELSLDPCIDIIEEKFEDIKLLNPFEARELLIKKNKEGVLTDEEIVQLDKAWFVSIFTENGIAWANRECVGELWEIWKNYGRIKIQNISREFKCREGVITLYDLISKQMDKSKYAGLQDTMIIQLEMVLKICEGLEINNSSEIGHVIPSAVVKKAHNKLSKQADNIRKTFNLRDRRKDKKSDDISYTDFMKLLSSVFSQFGVTSIKQLGRDYRKGVIQKYVIDTSPEFKKKHPKIKADVIYKEMLYAHLNIPKVNEMTNKQIKKGVIFESSLPP